MVQILISLCLATLPPGATSIQVPGWWVTDVHTFEFCHSVGVDVVYYRNLPNFTSKGPSNFWWN